MPTVLARSRTSAIQKRYFVSLGADIIGSVVLNGRYGVVLKGLAGGKTELACWTLYRPG